MKDATTPCCHVIWVLEIWLSALSVLMKLKYSKSSGRISDWWVIAKLKTTQPLPLLIFVVMFAGQSWIKAPELRTCLCQRRSVVTASLNSHSKRCFQSSACSDKTTQSLWHSDSTFLGSFCFLFFLNPLPLLLLARFQYRKLLWTQESGFYFITTLLPATKWNHWCLRWITPIISLQSASWCVLVWDF